MRWGITLEYPWLNELNRYDSLSKEAFDFLVLLLLQGGDRGLDANQKLGPASGIVPFGRKVQNLKLRRILGFIEGLKSKGFFLALGVEEWGFGLFVVGEGGDVGSGLDAVIR